jgi:tetratricopeptide (TPR) repeat protein
MKRTQRNLFIIMAAMVAFYSIVTRLPWQAALAVAGAVLAGFVALAVWGRDYFVGRRHARRRNWPLAIERLQRFERKALEAPWRRLAVVLSLSVYTFDVPALARNEIGQTFINANDLEQAATWLRAALQRDPQYAVPYVNLAVISALRRDAAAARRDMSKAVQLGYNVHAAQRILRRALESASSPTDES